MCIICDGKYHNIEYIDCDRCENLKELPSDLKVNKLDVGFCKNLTKIENIEVKTKLICMFCPKLKFINFIGSRTIDARHCISLENVSIHECLNIYLGNCRNLKNLSIDYGYMVHTDNCVNLIKISSKYEFRELHCEENRFLLEVPKTELYGDGCNWLNRTPIVDKQIVMIQQFFRRKRFLKRLILTRELKKYIVHDMIKIVIGY